MTPHLIILRVEFMSTRADVRQVIVGNPSLGLLAYDYWIAHEDDGLVAALDWGPCQVSFPDLVSSNMVVLKVYDPDALRATFKPF